MEVSEVKELDSLMKEREDKISELKNVLRLAALESPLELFESSLAHIGSTSARHELLESGVRDQLHALGECIKALTSGNSNECLLESLKDSFNQFSENFRILSAEKKSVSEIGEKALRDKILSLQVSLSSSQDKIKELTLRIPDINFAKVNSNFEKFESAFERGSGILDGHSQLSYDVEEQMKTVEAQIKALIDLVNEPPADLSIEEIRLKLRALNDTYCLFSCNHYIFSADHKRYFVDGGGAGAALDSCRSEKSVGAFLRNKEDRPSYQPHQSERCKSEKNIVIEKKTVESKTAVLSEGIALGLQTDVDDGVDDGQKEHTLESPGHSSAEDAISTSEQISEYKLVISELMDKQVVSSQPVLAQY